ncbi:DUF7575 domain-containing protein [Haladaptatus sp. SPP-AMP-3]|uniref:DUF7575 domain-containing protein n=1 Tax=Haladaptatus sp. SPP-AMP-3 TaxID=3121295 RepID=UPI003C2E9C0B
MRETIADTELGEYTIPGGTKILLPQFVVHSDERWYIDPSLEFCHWCTTELEQMNDTDGRENRR